MTGDVKMLCEDLGSIAFKNKLYTFKDFCFEIRNKNKKVLMREFVLNGCLIVFVRFDGFSGLFSCLNVLFLLAFLSFQSAVCF